MKQKNTQKKILTFTLIASATGMMLSFQNCAKASFKDLGSSGQASLGATVQPETTQVIPVAPVASGGGTVTTPTIPTAPVTTPPVATIPSQDNSGAVTQVDQGQGCDDDALGSDTPLILPSLSSMQTPELSSGAFRDLSTCKADPVKTTKYYRDRGFSGLAVIPSLCEDGPVQTRFAVGQTIYLKIIPSVYEAIKICLEREGSKGCETASAFFRIPNAVYTYDGDVYRAKIKVDAGMAGNAYKLFLTNNVWNQFQRAFTVCK